MDKNLAARLSFGEPIQAFFLPSAMVAVVIYNTAGIIMCIVTGALVSFASAYLPRGGGTWVLIGAWGVMAFVWDVLYRLFNRDVHWLHPARGGHMFFIPVCIFSGLALAWYVRHALAVGYWLPHMTPYPGTETTGH
jgi:hypothetical protein